MRALRVRALRPPKRRAVARREAAPARAGGGGDPPQRAHPSHAALVAVSQRAGRVTTRWDGRLRRRGKLRAARAGRYRVLVTVRSDRRPLRRSAVVRVLRKRR